MANITGTAGNNTLTGTTANDTITGLGGNDRLEGVGGNDRLDGGAGNDTLIGGAGNDILIGGPGVDMLAGGAGNDTYVIDGPNEINKATSDAGVDTVQSSVNYSLGAQQEHLTLTGSAALNGTGNELPNTLLGNTGNNTLNGLGGNDTLNGNNGNDTLTDAAGNDIANGGAGNDNINTGAGNDTLDGGADNDTLNGGTGNDRLLGGGGNDVIFFDALDTRGVDGGGGADVLKVNGPTTANLVSLNAGGARFLNFELIDMAATGAQTVILDEGTVLGALTSTDTLRIKGTAIDAVQAAGSWTAGEDLIEGTITWKRFESGDATLLVQNGVNTTGITLAETGPTAVEDHYETAGGLLGPMPADQSTGNLIELLLSNDSGNGLFISGVSEASAGTVFLDDNDTPENPLDDSLIFTANGLEFIASGSVFAVTFTYTIMDVDSNTDTAIVTLQISGANEPPAMTGDLAATVAEGDDYVLAGTDLYGVDPDDASPELTFTVTSLTDGVIKLNGEDSTTFTASDIIGGLVRFVHDGSEGSGAGFTVSLADGGEDGAATETDTFTFTVTAVNDAPVITGDLATSVEDDGIVTLTPADLGELDPDDDGAGLTYTVSNQSHGQIKLSNVAVSNFTAQDVADGLVTFVHDGLVGTTSFDVSLADGGEDGAATDTATFSLTVIPTNDGPANSKPGAQTTNENTALVFSSGTFNTISVGDGDTNNLTVTLTATNGTLTLFGTGGLSFISGDGTADVTMSFSGLIANLNNALNGMTFTPSSNFSGSAGLTIATSDGIETDTDSVTITVEPVNDSPVIAGDLSATTAEGATYTITTADLGESDPDDSGTGLTYTTSSVVNGAVKLNGSGTTTFTAQDVTNGLVSFTHNGSETVSASFSVALADGGENSAATDTDTFNFTVTPVNDAPVIAGDLAASVAQGSTYALTTTDLGEADPDDSGSGLTYTVSNQVNGTVKLNGSPSTTFTAQNVADSQVSFTHNGSATSSASFNVSLADGGENGAAPDTDSFTFTVTPPNNPPNGANATVIVGISNVHTFAPLEFGFADDPGNTLQAVRIDSLPGNGTLLLNGGNFSAGLVVAVDDIDLLQFFPDIGESGTPYASFNFSVQDNDDNFDTTPNTITFNVVTTNPPSLSVDTVPGSLFFTTGEPPVYLDGTVDITDTDSTTLAGATLTFQSGFQSGDLLNFTNQSGITGNYNTSTGELTLSGSATLANYEAALESITFSTTNFALVTRMVRYVVEDPTGSTSAPDTVQVGVNTSHISLSGLNGFNGFEVHGELPNDGVGTGVSNVGDVNGDGFDDYLLGAPGFDSPAYAAGISYVMFGQANFSDTYGGIFLDGLSGVNVAFIVGEGLNNGAGSAIGNAGDVNGDGFDDMIIGAGTNGAYVVFGKSGFTSLNLSTLNGSNGFQITGEVEGDNAGVSVATAGDVNGDGFDDMIIGAWLADPNTLTNSGASYVVFGKASGFASNLDLSALNGSNGFQISGVATNDYSGLSVSGAGDVNGDGFDDYIVSAYYGDSGGTYESGTTYVVFGKATGFASNLNLSTITGANGFAIRGEATGDLSGISVSDAGDVNGDGFADIIVGAHHADPNGSSSGASYVIFGAPSFGAAVSLSGLNGVNGFQISGELANHFSGNAVSSAGDVNGDGLDDLLVAAYRANTTTAGAGATYVIFGEVSGFASNLNLSALDGTNGLQISGENSQDRIGISLSSAGDVNGDGFDDILIGAPGVNVHGNDDGAAYVVYGRDFHNEVNLPGTSGTDNLNGGSGNEIGVGGLGNDTINGNAGNDVLKGANGNDTLNGGAGNDRLEGANGNDTLDGGADIDRLDGGDGIDSLDGGLGNDVLTGGGDNDVFVFNDVLGATNVDTIMDFAGAGATNLDKINLENTGIFTALATPGALNASNFLANTTGNAATTTQFIIYNTTTGELFYDADGSTATISKVLFAVIASDVDGLTAADFMVI